MSDSNQSMNSAPRKRKLDIDHYKDDVHTLPTSPYQKSARQYVRPTDQQIAEILARVEQPDYKGLDTTHMIGKPHPIADVVFGDSNEPAVRAVDGDILECGSTTMLDPAAHKNNSSKEEAALRTSLIIVAIHHHVSDAMIGEFCIPAGVPSGEIENNLRNRVLKQFQSIQSTAGKFFLKVVKDTREHFDGEEFDFAPPAKRQATWEQVWEQAQYQTAKAMLGQCASVVDLENIFLHKTQDEVRVRWQKLFKSQFVMGCQVMTQNCPGPRDMSFAKPILLWYRFWRDLPNTTRWQQTTDLWNMRRLPVKPTAVKRG